MAINIIVATFLALLACNHEPSHHTTDIAPPDSLRVVEYEIDVRLVVDRHQLEASVTARLPVSPATRSVIPFTLRSDMENLRVEVMEPAEGTGQQPVLRDVGEDPNMKGVTRWELQLTPPLPAGEPVTLRVRYAGGDSTGLTFYVGPEASFASNGTVWYPQFYELRGVGALSVMVPPRWAVRASGISTGQHRTDSAAVFTFANRWPVGFSFAAGPYHVRRIEGDVPIELYLLRDRPWADDLANVARRVLPVLEEEFGPYPFGEFAVVEVPTGPAQQAGFLGAANEGFMLMREDFLDSKGADVGFFGHEIGHQWWGNIVEHTGERGEYMLDEAMAQYGALRAVETILGPSAAERIRRDGGRGALRLIAAGLDLPLGHMPAVSDAAYTLADTKGFLVYDLLARTVGRYAFRAALHRIVNANAFRSVTWEVFLSEVEQAAGQDLDWFYDQWFTRSGAPVLSLAWEPRDSLVQVKLTQREPTYRLTLPVVVEYEDGGATVVEAEVDGIQTELSVPARRGVYGVTFDPHYEVFHATPEAMEEARALRFYTRGRLLWDHGQTDEALRTFQVGLDSLSTPDAHGAEFLLRMHLGWIHQEAKRLAEAIREYEAALAVPVRVEEQLPQVYINLARTAKALGDTLRMRRAARHVIAAERALGQETSKSRAAERLLTP